MVGYNAEKKPRFPTEIVPDIPHFAQPLPKLVGFLGKVRGLFRLCEVRRQIAKTRQHCDFSCT
jgi:hypothetical protein